MGDHAPASEPKTTRDLQFWTVTYIYTSKNTRWEIGDHDRASDARPRCDRTLCGVKYVLDKLIGVKTTYISNLYIMRG